MKKDNNTKYSAIQKEVVGIILNGVTVNDGVHSLIINDLNSIVCEARCIADIESKRPYVEAIAHIEYELKPYTLVNSNKEKVLMYLTIMMMM